MLKTYVAWTFFLYFCRCELSPRTTPSRSLKCRVRVLFPLHSGPTTTRRVSLFYVRLFTTTTFVPFCSTRSLSSLPGAPVDTIGVGDGVMNLPDIALDDIFVVVVVLFFFFLRLGERKVCLFIYLFILCVCVYACMRMCVCVRVLCADAFVIFPKLHFFLFSIEPFFPPY